jgi:trimethylamine--corrinoid protein Co-methyltransferase
MLVFCDMMIGRAKHILRPVDMSDDALAVDVIDEVVRNGEFYTVHPHTAEHFRKSLWMPPRYINRKRLADARLDDLPRLLGQEVRRIAFAHTPKPLPADRAAEVARYLAGL